MEPPSIVLIVIGAAFAFVIFWLTIVWFIAQVAGWPKLAEKYPAREPWNPQCWSLQSALVRGWSQYRAVLRFCADSEKLHISVLFPFSIAHKPLSIPWHEISGVKKTRWFIYGVELRFQQAPNIPIHITTNLANRLVEAASGAWQYEK
ncbi:MAG: hypothetical protein H6658_07670 [Ardenticatenaceae bacterium]|nr:hypothetical protein [Ardenticatenaceae bacterium]